MMMVMVMMVSLVWKLYPFDDDVNIVVDDDDNDEDDDDDDDDDDNDITKKLLTTVSQCHASITVKLHPLYRIQQSLEFAKGFWLSWPLALHLYANVNTEPNHFGQNEFLNEVYSPQSV